MREDGAVPRSGARQKRYPGGFFCSVFSYFFYLFSKVVSGRFLVRFGGHFGSLLASFFHYFSP